MYQAKLESSARHLSIDQKDTNKVCPIHFLATELWYAIFDKFRFVPCPAATFASLRETCKALQELVVQFLEYQSNLSIAQDLLHIKEGRTVIKLLPFMRPAPIKPELYPFAKVEESFSSFTFFGKNSTDICFFGKNETLVIVGRTFSQKINLNETHGNFAPAKPQKARRHLDPLPHEKPQLVTETFLIENRVERFNTEPNAIKSCLLIDDQIILVTFSCVSVWQIEKDSVKCTSHFPISSFFKHEDTSLQNERRRNFCVAALIVQENLHLQISSYIVRENLHAQIFSYGELKTAKLDLYYLLRESKIEIKNFLDLPISSFFTLDNNRFLLMDRCFFKAYSDSVPFFIDTVALLSTHQVEQLLTDNSIIPFKHFFKEIAKHEEPDQIFIFLPPQANESWLIIPVHRAKKGISSLQIHSMHQDGKTPFEIYINNRPQHLHFKLIGNLLVVQWIESSAVRIVDLYNTFLAKKEVIINSQLPDKLLEALIKETLLSVEIEVTKDRKMKWKMLTHKEQLFEHVFDIDMSKTLI